MASDVAVLANQRQQALLLIQQGDLGGAESVLERMLQSNRLDADALRLKGCIRQMQNRFAEAAALFRASLAANDRQPAVHNILGVVLAGLGDAAGAEASYRRALALDPANTGAVSNLASILASSARADEALKMLEAALAAAPNDARLHETRAMALFNSGQLQPALDAARRSVALAPNSLGANYNLGQALLAAGEVEAAADALKRAAQLGPGTAKAWLALGGALAQLGRIDEAIAACRRAVALDAGAVQAHELLNELIFQAGEAGYLASYPEAIRARPADAHLRFAYAKRLLQVQQYAAAEAELRTVAAAAPGDAGVHDALARSLAGRGDYDAALSEHAFAFDRAREDPLVARNYLETLLKAGRSGEAIDVGRIARARFPLEQGVLAYYTTALRLAGEPEYAAIADYHRLPGLFEIEPPEGYPDIAAFNAALAAQLRKLHAAKRNPTEQTLRGGTQTPGALFDRNEPIVRQLEQQLRKAVARYIAGLPEGPSHPFLGRKSGNFDFSGSWSVRLERNGFHTNHFHPAGWISSAYYLELPEDVADEASHAGWFKMGETHMELGPLEAEPRYVRPAPGRLVLFPSYFWHGTVPFAAGESRLTVAFDVVPA